MSDKKPPIDFANTAQRQIESILKEPADTPSNVCWHPFREFAIGCPKCDGTGIVNHDILSFTKLNETTTFNRHRNRATTTDLSQAEEYESELLGQISTLTRERDNALAKLSDSAYLSLLKDLNRLREKLTDVEINRDTWKYRCEQLTVTPNPESDYIDGHIDALEWVSSEACGGEEVHKCGDTLMAIDSRIMILRKQKERLPK